MESQDIFGNIQLNRLSTKVKAFEEKFSSMPALVKEFAMTRTMSQNHAFMKEKNINLTELVALQAIAKKRLVAKSAVDFSMEVSMKSPTEYNVVQKDSNLYYTDGVEHKSVKGFRMEEKLKLDGEALFSFVTSILQENKVVYKPVDRVSGAGEKIQIKPEAVAPIIDVLNEEQISSMELAKERIVSAVSVHRNIAVANLLVDTAPPAFPMTIATRKNEKTNKNEIEIRPKSVPKVSIIKEVGADRVKNADVFLSKISATAYPASSGLCEFANRHVYGVPIRKDMKKYVSLLTDCPVNDDIKEIHVYSSDIRYAIGFSNRYKNTQVYVASSSFTPTSKGKVMIRGDSAKVLRQRAKNSPETILGVFINYQVAPKMKGTDYREKSAQVDLNSENDNYEEYKRYFRYLSVFAAIKKKKYYFSSNTSENKICESTEYGDTLDGDEIYFAYMSVCLHRYAYMWQRGVLYPLLQPYIRPLVGIYDFTITVSETSSLMMSGLLDNAADNDEYGLWKQYLEDKVKGENNSSSFVVTVDSNNNNTNNNVVTVAPVPVNDFNDYVASDDEDEDD